MDDAERIVRGSQLNFTAPAADIIKTVYVYGRVLKSMNRDKFILTISRLGSRFFSGPTYNDDIKETSKMADLLIARPELKEKVAVVMDSGTFATTMDRCHYQRNVSVHVNTDKQLKDDMAALVADGVVDLFESELPDECTIVRRHADFLAMLGT